jgi:hypothetical protein
MIELSDAPCDKIYAAACHDLGTTADVGADYLEACVRWYADLTPQERTLATAAVAAFDLGLEPAATDIARLLPPAPVFPP